MNSCPEAETKRGTEVCRAGFWPLRACADAQAGCARAAAPRARANENGVPALVPARPVHPLPLASPSSRNGLCSVPPEPPKQHQSKARPSHQLYEGEEVRVPPPPPHNSGASLGASVLSAIAVRGARSTSQYDSAPPRSASSHLPQSARRTILRCASSACAGEPHLSAVSAQAGADRRSAQNVLPPDIRARAALACLLLASAFAVQAQPSGSHAEDKSFPGIPTCLPFPARSALAPSTVPSSAVMLPSRDG